MRLDLRRFKIEKAAHQDKKYPRAAIAQPYLDVDESVLVATDSYVLAVVPVELDDGDASGPVPTAALVESRRRLRPKDRAHIALNGRAEVADGEVSFRRPVVPKFVDWQTITKAKGAPQVVFGINPFKLAQLAEAMGCGKDEGLRVEFYDPHKGIHVSHSNGARGVIMPVRIA